MTENANNNPAPDWSDLTARLGSAVLMAIGALIAIWIGGIVFWALVAAICGAMVWELVRMLLPLLPSRAQKLGLLSAGAVFLCGLLPGLFILPLIGAVVLVGMRDVTERKDLFAGFTIAILLAGVTMGYVRDLQGAMWLIWLVLVVIASDVAGYFAGKAFGGPKFWPRVSPKKTWSGTVAGWLAAAVIGMIFAGATSAGNGLILVSVLVAVAAQFGDIAESALKRLVGVKDSSALIPGHGGLYDRFDGMIGGALCVMLIWLIAGFPGGV